MQTPAEVRCSYEFIRIDHPALLKSLRTHRTGVRDTEGGVSTSTRTYHLLRISTEPSQPNKWYLFQNILIGTIAGVIASGVVNRGAIYVFGLASGFWIVLIMALKASKPIFDWIENKENDEDAKDRPYQNAKCAS
ncbi:hypothetical protein [Halorubrum sp. PV6]|uniref:hypothetical protein n=1 Tax=Halorubrum sp. PV6 TaxID=634157 RepID=UPI000F8E2D63|nr:hypothetical protein [Halorubrum sp. PV6]